MKNVQSIPLPLHMLSPTRPGFNFYCLCLLPFRAVTQLLILPSPPRLTLQTGKGKWKKAPFAAATAVPPPFSLAETFRFPFLFPLHLRAERGGRGERAWEGGRRDRPTDLWGHYRGTRLLLLLLLPPLFLLVVAVVSAPFPTERDRGKG